MLRLPRSGRQSAEVVERATRRVAGGSALRLSKQRQRAEVVEGAAGRVGPIPDHSVPHLEPLERSDEWSPALKVLTRHKNGAPTPREPIINEF